MARVNNIPTNLQSLKEVPNLARFTSAAIDSIVSQVNGKLDFVDNVRVSGPLAVAFTTPNVAVKVIHFLGRQPVGYLVIGQDAAASIYFPSLVTFPWTSTQIYLSASAIVNAQVFVL